jgi:hypothetical protein
MSNYLQSHIIYNSVEINYEKFKENQIGFKIL